MKLIDSFRRSAAQLRDLRSLTGASLLLALSILLTYFFRLDFGGSLSVGLSFNATALMGMLFGPVVTGLANGLGDIIKCVLKPQGPYFFGYTFNAMLAGVIYGSFYYRKPLSLGRVFAAHLVVSLVCNVLLNTLCLSLLYGKAFMVLLPPRVIKNLIMWPIDSLIFFHIAKLLEAAGIFRFLGGRDQNRL